VAHRAHAWYERTKPVTFDGDVRKMSWVCVAEVEDGNFLRHERVLTLPPSL